MQRNKIVLALLALFLCLSGLVSAQASDVPPLSLTAGDVLRIAIWREADLSGDFPVDENGDVTLPLIGRTKVINRSFEEVKGALIDAYSKQLRNPSISITPLRRIYVLGEVARPGLFTIDPTITLAGVVALAGGATASGDLNKTRIVRKGSVVLENVPSSSFITSIDVRSDDQIFVDRRSWFDRNSGIVVSGLISAFAIAVSLLVR